MGCSAFLECRTKCPIRFRVLEVLWQPKVGADAVDALRGGQKLLGFLVLGQLPTRRVAHARCVFLALNNVLQT